MQYHQSLNIYDFLDSQVIKQEFSEWFFKKQRELTHMLSLREIKNIMKE